MEVGRDAPARPVGQAVGEVRVVVAVLTVGAEAGVDRGDRAIDRRHGGKIAIRALAKGLLRNRQDLLQDRAVEGESAGDRGAIASAAQQLRAHVAIVERLLRRRVGVDDRCRVRSAEHTSELQSLMRTSYAVFCLKNKQNQRANTPIYQT